MLLFGSKFPCLCFLAFFDGAFDSQNELQILTSTFIYINLIDLWKVFLYDSAYFLDNLVTLDHDWVNRPNFCDFSSTFGSFEVILSAIYTPNEDIFT